MSSDHSEHHDIVVEGPRPSPRRVGPPGLCSGASTPALVAPLPGRGPSSVVCIDSVEQLDQLLRERQAAPLRHDGPPGLGSGAFGPTLVAPLLDSDLSGAPPCAPIAGGGLGGFPVGHVPVCGDSGGIPVAPARDLENEQNLAELAGLASGRQEPQVGKRVHLALYFPRPRLSWQQWLKTRGFHMRLAAPAQSQWSRRKAPLPH